jgi:hypothetical protein
MRGNEFVRELTDRTNALNRKIEIGLRENLERERGYRAAAAAGYSSCANGGGGNHARGGSGGSFLLTAALVAGGWMRLHLL